MDDLHPDTINRYYGVEGAPRSRRPGQTGAGHPEDEEDENEDQWIDEPEEYLTQAVTEDLAHNIRHPAIKVARHKNPFRSALIEHNFVAALAEIVRQGLVPRGYGVLQDEWEDGTYPSMEAINPGTRGKEIVVVLPRDVWLPRAVYFSQALDAMTRSLMFQEETGPAEGEEGYNSAGSSQAEFD
ncbi:hypothetical protein B0H11DRAFT_1720157 [Mycena galericulata]|nr:hypothetical protein B0H11DRAFT_1720157 [Mycena galericulata]